MKLSLDLSQSQLMSSRIVVPTGNYNLEVMSATAQSTSKGGGMLVVEFKVLTGERAGTILKRNINIVNVSADAQRIAYAEVKTIMVAGKHRNPDMLGDSDELIGLKSNAYIEEKPTSFINTRGETVQTTENEFKSYQEMSDVAQQVTAPPAGTPFPPPAGAPVGPNPPAPAAPVGGSQFPWAK